MLHTARRVALLIKRCGTHASAINKENSQRLFGLCRQTLRTPHYSRYSPTARSSHALHSPPVSHGTQNHTRVRHSPCTMIF
ncbi:hypothetical protein BDW68DRAFT_171517 [Aspergillus falconensis]